MTKENLILRKLTDLLFTCGIEEYRLDTIDQTLEVHSENFSDLYHAIKDKTSLVRGRVNFQYEGYTISGYLGPSSDKFDLDEI